MRVVGGGPAGMILGLLLARAGVEVTVLEKHARLPARLPRRHRPHLDADAARRARSLAPVRGAALPRARPGRASGLDAGEADFADLTAARRAAPDDRDGPAVAPARHARDRGARRSRPSRCATSAEVTELVRDAAGRVTGVRCGDRSPDGVVADRAHPHRRPRRGLRRARLPRPGPVAACRCAATTCPIDVVVVPGPAGRRRPDGRARAGRARPVHGHARPRRLLPVRADLIRRARTRGCARGRSRGCAT